MSSKDAAVQQQAMVINQRSPTPTQGLNYNPLFESSASASFSSSQQGMDSGPDQLQLLNMELQGFVMKKSHEAMEASKWNMEVSSREARTSEQNEIIRLQGVVRALETTSQHMHGRMHKLEDVCASLHAAVMALQSTILDAGICPADTQPVRQREGCALASSHRSLASSVDSQPRIPHMHLARGALSTDPSYAVCEDTQSSAPQRSHTSEDFVQGDRGHGMKGRAWGVPALGIPPQPEPAGVWTDMHKHTRKVRWAEGASDGNDTSHARRASCCAVFSEGIPDTGSQLAKFHSSLTQLPARPEASSQQGSKPHPFRRSSSSRTLLGGGAAVLQSSEGGDFEPPRRVTIHGGVLGHKHGESDKKGDEREDLRRVPPSRLAQHGGIHCRHAERSEEGRKGLRGVPSKRFTFNGGIRSGKDPSARQDVSARRGYRQRPKAEEEGEEPKDDDLGILFPHPGKKLGEMSHWADAHERVSATTMAAIKKADSF